MTSENLFPDKGASFPPIYPGPSWNVPRVSLPGLFGMQPQFTEEWWYYVGTVYDEEGTAFSLQIQIIRAGEIGYGITGIGYRDGDNSCYISGQGFGLGAGYSSDSKTFPSVVVPPVSDKFYSASFVPGLDLGGPLGLSIATDSRWKFEYLSDASNKHPLGHVGSKYSIEAHGQGYKNGDVKKLDCSYSILLNVEDQRGTVMEGISGYVGPEMFAGGNADAPASYECAQPHLKIQTGTLVIDGKTHNINKGYLWLDRQMVDSKPTGNGTKSINKEDAEKPTNAEELKSYLAKNPIAPKSLYLGDWMSFVLDNGIIIVLAEFWQKPKPGEKQWITGTKVGKPPLNGFGNLYFPLDTKTPPMNGGMGLRSGWDFEVNILYPKDPQNSPHWKSPISGNTYATAWQIDFAPRFTKYGIPEKLYVFAICENCEILPPLGGAFFEGAALVYADKEKTQPLGHVFVEQMGFN
jgi:hypothetical protein